MKTHILGDGCAAMMLASMKDQLPNHDLTIVHPTDAPMGKDHMLGFWNTDGLDFAVNCSRKSWSKWAIITNTEKNVMHSENHAYHIMHKATFLEQCRNKAEQLNVQFAEQSTIKADDSVLTFDSRPPRSSHGAMLQHFLGQEIEVDSLFLMHQLQF